MMNVKYLEQQHQNKIIYYYGIKNNNHTLLKKYEILINIKI